MIKMQDVTHWLCRELEGTGFLRSDRAMYAVAEETWVNEGRVYVKFGNETLILTLDRHPEA